MTSFVMMNAEKLREKMAEQKDADHDQTTWVSAQSRRLVASQDAGWWKGDCVVVHAISKHGKSFILAGNLY